MADKLVAVFGLSVLASALPLCAGEPKQSFEVVHTERVPFAPSGTIRINNSYGYLTVEGWDEPAVEITVIKSTDRFYEPSRSGQEEQLLKQIDVVLDRRSANELAITTSLPARNRLLTSVLPNNKRGVTVEYRIHVPRNSQLVIRHDNGYVWVGGVDGGIEVHSHTGDMIVMLPGAGQYSFDARTGLGAVSSDFAGQRVKHYLAGTHFSDPGEGSPQRIHLRMGRGSITIKKEAE